LAVCAALTQTPALGFLSARAATGGTNGKTPSAGAPAAAAANARGGVPAANQAAPVNGAGGSNPAGAASDETPPPITGSPRLPGLAARPAPAEQARPPADPGQRRVWLKAALDEAFSAPSLAKAKIGVEVLEPEAGKPLYVRGEKMSLNAASNVKIVTSAAALALLGPDYRWRTTLSAAGGAKGSATPAIGAGGEIAGDLILKGMGDPTLGTQALAAMVADLAAMGVRRIKGGIVADESFFDGTHVGPAYDQKTDSTVSRAPSAALSLNGNVVEISVIPGAKAGAAARIVVDPPSAAFVVSGRIVTAASGPAAASIETKEEAGGRTQILVSGRVRLGSEPRGYNRRVVNPPLYAAYTLKALLERRGITVAGNPKVGTTPAGATAGMRVLSTHESAPMGVVAHDLNKRSNNFVAEQVLRTLGAEIIGRPGTWDKGLEAVGRYLNTLGIRKGTYQMNNGSGLYDSNRFSPEQITTILRGAMRDFRIAAEFMASLAVAGTDGTIGHRMGNTPAERFVRAKTGTLIGTSCLSGFAGAPGRPPLIFSILMNDVPAATDARRAQDRAAEALVAYIEADTPAAAKP
jgi:D-alanyl-D-alanine carboxypeptidase/D-alanyl-D-alanine-endopeptidase (penicillin-binding protein 4)